MVSWGERTRGRLGRRAALDTFESDYRKNNKVPMRCTKLSGRKPIVNLYCHRYSFRRGVGDHEGPARNAISTAGAAPWCHGSPCPGSTERAPVSASAASEANARGLSAVAAPDTICGPLPPVYGSRVTSASPESTASRSGRCRAQCPHVWPGVNTTRGRPGTGSRVPASMGTVSLSPRTKNASAKAIFPRTGRDRGYLTGYPSGLRSRWYRYG